MHVQDISRYRYNELRCRFIYCTVMDVLLIDILCIGNWKVGFALGNLVTAVLSKAVCNYLVFTQLMHTIILT